MSEEERPEPTDSHSPADERPEDQPQDPTQATRACTMPEKSTPSREKGAEGPPDPKPRPVRIAHPFWRGWWLAVILLGCIVVLGQEPPHLSDWLHPPLRPFAGGILLGCALGALPRVMRKRGGEAS